MTLILRRFVAFIQWCRTPKKTIHAARREKVHPLPPSASQARLRQGARKSRPLTSTERTCLKRSLTEQIKSLSPKEIADRMRRMQRTLEERENTSQQVLARAREEQDQAFSDLDRAKQDCARLAREIGAARQRFEGATRTINLLRASLRSESVKAAELQNAREQAADAKKRCASLEKELAAARLVKKQCAEKELAAGAPPVYSEEDLRDHAAEESKRTCQEKLDIYESRWNSLRTKSDGSKPNAEFGPGSLSFVRFPWPTFVTPTLGCPTSGPDSPFRKEHIMKFLSALHAHLESKATASAFVKVALRRYHSDKQSIAVSAVYSPHSEATVAAMHEITCVLNDILGDATAKARSQGYT